MTIRLILFILLLQSGNLFADTYITENIISDTRWTRANSPYIIVNDISVKEGAVLMIEPGTTVLFSYHTMINIYGTLTAKGSRNKKIIFKGKNSGAWNGFDYHKGCGNYDTLSNSGCVFEFCHFYGSGDAPDNLIRTQGCTLKMENCWVENCYTAVHSERQAKIYLFRNTFLNCDRPVNISNTSLGIISENRFKECNSILLGGTTDFYKNRLEHFTDKGRHSGLIIRMIGGAVVTVEKNEFKSFKGNAVKVYKMSRRSTFIMTENNFKKNYINLNLSCEAAGIGKLQIENNNFGQTINNQLIIDQCDSGKSYRIGPNYWEAEDLNFEKTEIEPPLEKKVKILKKSEN